MLSKKVMGEQISEYDMISARIKELESRLDEIKSSMTSEMERRGVDVLEVGNRVVRWTPYTSQRFDSTGFRKAQPELYSEWVKEVKGRRFSVT